MSHFISVSYILFIYKLSVRMLSKSTYQDCVQDQWIQLCPLYMPIVHSLASVPFLKMLMVSLQSLTLLV